MPIFFMRTSDLYEGVMVLYYTVFSVLGQISGLGFDSNTLGNTTSASLILNLEITVLPL